MVGWGMNLCLILHGIASRVAYHRFIDQRKTHTGFMHIVFRGPTDCLSENLIPCRGLYFAGWTDRRSSTASFQSFIAKDSHGHNLNIGPK